MNMVNVFAFHGMAAPRTVSKIFTRRYSTFLRDAINGIDEPYTLRGYDGQPVIIINNYAKGWNEEKWSYDQFNALAQPRPNSFSFGTYYGATRPILPQWNTVVFASEHHPADWFENLNDELSMRMLRRFDVIVDVGSLGNL